MSARVVWRARFVRKQQSEIKDRKLVAQPLDLVRALIVLRFNYFDST